MFEVNELWQSKVSEVLEGMFSLPQARRYRLVELSLNVQLFHVDVHSTVDDEIYWSRYILDNIADVLDVISECCASTIKISLQSSRQDMRDYIFDVVDEILESLEFPGAYFFRCRNGDVRVDSMHELSFDNARVKLIWKSLL